MTLRWLREQTDENEAQQAQSDGELHPDGSKQEETTHLTERKKQREGAGDETRKVRREEAGGRRQERSRWKGCRKINPVRKGYEKRVKKRECARKVGGETGGGIGRGAMRKRRQKERGRSEEERRKLQRGS